MSNAQRFHFVDIARGFIIICMALDHAQVMIKKGAHGGEAWYNAMPDYDGDGALFLTRWVTHLCAPGFFFLMGVSLALYSETRRAANTQWREIEKHFAIRGLILLFLQFTLINIAWGFGALSAADISENLAELNNTNPVFLYFGVLASLGSAMLILAFMLRLNNIALGSLSLLVIIGSFSLFPHVDQAEEPFSIFERLLWVPGQTSILLVRYPILPWIGVAGLGVVYGRLLKQDSKTAQKGLFIGLILIAFFAISRVGFAWGDHHLLESLDWISILNVTKYPPSLNFLAVTLGLNLVILYLAQALKLADYKVFKFLTVFGSCTLFFYVVHLYVYGVLGYLFPQGSSLAIAYTFWLVGLLALYPLCIWWRSVKRSKPKTSWVQYI